MAQNTIYNWLGKIVEKFRKTDNNVSDENQSKDENQVLISNTDGLVPRSKPIRIDPRMIPKDKIYSYEEKMLKRILNSEEFDNIYDNMDNTFFHYAYNKSRCCESISQSPFSLEFAKRNRGRRLPRPTPRKYVHHVEEEEDIFYVSMSEDEEQTTEL